MKWITWMYYGLFFLILAMTLFTQPSFAIGITVCLPQVFVVTVLYSALGPLFAKKDTENLLFIYKHRFIGWILMNIFMLPFIFLFGFYLLVLGENVPTEVLFPISFIEAFVVLGFFFSIRTYKKCKQEEKRLFVANNEINRSE